MRALALIALLVLVPAKRTRRPDAPPPKPRPTFPSPERSAPAPQGPQPGDRQVHPR